MQLFNIGNRSVNLYLLKSSTHNFLIDSGFPNTINGLGRSIRQAGVKLREVNWVMVTHFHPDHAGAVQELKNEGVRFVLVDLQVPFVDKMEIMMTEKWNYQPLTRSDNKIITVEESRAFLRSLNIEGRFVFTPGHSEDSISVLLDTGEAFTGDLTAAFGESLDPVVNRSWMSLKNQGAKTVYPGHGDIYELT